MDSGIVIGKDMHTDKSKDFFGLHRIIIFSNNTVRFIPKIVHKIEHIWLAHWLESNSEISISQYFSRLPFFNSKSAFKADFKGTFRIIRKCLKIQQNLFS